MAFLRDVSNRVWGFISPRKTQQRRDKPFKVPAVPIKRAKTPMREELPVNMNHHLDMSPRTRVQQWEISTPTSNGLVDPAQLPPSPKSLDRQYYDLDNETLIEDLEEMNPEGEPAWNANEDTLVDLDDGELLNQKKKAAEREIELARRREQARNLRSAGWAEDAVFLFQKLGNRGYEALLPFDWYNDFVMLPGFLFTRKRDAAFIKSECGSDFHAQKALNELFNVGPRARDAVRTKAPVRTAEYQIRRGIQDYDRWAMKEDGGFATDWNDLSLFQIHTCPKNASSSDLEAKATRRLGRLAAKWRDAIRDRVTQDSQTDPDNCPVDYDTVPDVPTLYAVLASHTVMAFVSYDARAARPCLRTIAMFDFGQEDYDVWNAFAIAIFVIHCRNRMIELEDYLPYAQAAKESDPDL